jgi:sugar fermentation stimulation protein A
MSQETGRDVPAGLAGTNENAMKRCLEKGLAWPDLTAGVLVKRYKRFLADVRLADGAVITAHCPNSGSMLGCAEPGRTVYVSRQNAPGRKLHYTWELIAMPSSLVGINTGVPNRLIKQAADKGLIAELRGYERVEAEVRVGNTARLDLMLSRAAERCYVEVKNCTLVVAGAAMFPDAVTARGLKHLVELQRLAAEGCRCVMFYLIQRMDARTFGPAERIDPAYGQELRRAMANGVEVLVYDTVIDLAGICLGRKIPLHVEPACA